MSGRLRRAWAVAGAATLLALPLASAAPAVDRQDAEEVRVRKVVDAVVDSDGEVADARLFTALEVTGEGEVEVADPTSLDRLRRLDAVGAPARRADAAVWRLEPDPTAAVHTVADHDRPLPVAMQARYRVDGVTVSPGGFATADGRADLRFAVRNVSARPVELEWPTADRVTSETVDVPIPMVARVRAVFGSGWRGLEAPGAAVATDGEGNTIVEWTTVLFPPLGSTDVELAVTADEAGPSAPDVALEAAPAGTVRDRPLADATALLRDGSTDAAVLAFAFGELGGGIDELADGVAELAEGIAALAEGTGGLAGGIEEAAGGAGELADGVAGLAGGASQLAEGTEGLAGGTAEIAGGTRELAGGLGQLAEAGQGLAAGSGELAAGLTELDAGVTELAGGASELTAAADGVAVGTRALADALADIPDALPTDDLEENLAVLVGTLEGLGEHVGDAAAIIGVLEATQGRIDDLAGRAETVEDPELREALLVTAAELRSLLADVQERAGGLLAGVGEGVPAATEALAGIGDLLGGLPDAGPGPTGEVDALADGAEAVAAGVDGLAAALAALAEGTGEAAAGAQQLTDGAGGLAAGAGEAAGGAAALAEGTGGLAEASAGLAGGARGLADGADAAAEGTAGLAEGLDEAAGGASELADGAAEAAGGTEALGGGAAGLADYADRVAGAADDAASDAARDVALLRAGQQRADEDGVPYGAPEGARASAAYRLTFAEPEAHAPVDVRWLLLGGLLGAAALLPGLASRRSPTRARRRS